MSKIEMVEERFNTIDANDMTCINENDEVELVLRKLIWRYIDPKDDKRVSDWLDERVVAHDAMKTFLSS